jgi:hypothetical protein
MIDLLKLFAVFFVVLFLAIGHVRRQDESYSEFVKASTSRSNDRTLASEGQEIAYR